MIRALVCLTLWLSSAPVWAHKLSDSYLSLHVHGGQVQSQWDIALRDLDYAIGLDRDGDGAITWGELRSRHVAIATYALSRLAFSGDDTRCETYAREQRVDYHSDGAYAVLRFQADCGHAPRTLSLRYDLFFDLDPQHRGLLRLGEGLTRTAILARSAGYSVWVSLSRILGPALDYAREGMWTWVGYDHILFLVVLLPAVLCREAGRRQAQRFSGGVLGCPQDRHRVHGGPPITLSLAALGVIALPARWVESAIAASVVLAALNNLIRVPAALARGVCPGWSTPGLCECGGGPGPAAHALLVALLGFNLGVEAGQLLIVAGRCRLRTGCAILVLSALTSYRVVANSGVAFIWLLERSLDLRLLAP
jgi:hypothetical protein